MWQSFPKRVSDDGEYDSPKSLRSTCASGNVNLFAFMPRYSGTTAFGGAFGGSGFPSLRVIGTVSGSPYSS